MARGPAPKNASPPASTGSTLGPSTRVRGRIQGEGDLRVEGQVEGEVDVTGDLVLDDGASIEGNVSAQAVTLGGRLVGDVNARGAVVVTASAKVQGNLGGTEVSLDEGASFVGRIEADFDLPEGLVARN